MYAVFDCNSEIQENAVFVSLIFQTYIMTIWNWGTARTQKDLEILVVQTPKHLRTQKDLEIL